MNPDSATRNEAALACAARQGDREALLALLQSNWSWLKGLAYNIVGNADDVDDILQNVCVSVIAKIETLRQPERFKPWLAAIARNAALGFRQQRSRRPIQLDEAVTSQQRDESLADIAETLTHKQLCGRILEAVKALPDKYAEAFILKHIEQHSYSEMAEILDVPVTTVQIRLVRARRMIHNRLTGKPTHKIPRT